MKGLYLCPQREKLTILKLFDSPSVNVMKLVVSLSSEANEIKVVCLTAVSFDVKS